MGLEGNTPQSDLYITPYDMTGTDQITHTLSCLDQ